MKSFTQWLTEQGHTLDMPTTEPTPENNDVPAGEKTTKENRVRTGWSKRYPPAYFSAQYPTQYVMPHKATAALDAEQMGKK